MVVSDAVLPCSWPCGRGVEEEVLVALDLPRQVIMLTPPRTRPVCLANLDAQPSI